MHFLGKCSVFCAHWASKPHFDPYHSSSWCWNIYFLHLEGKHLRVWRILPTWLEGNHFSTQILFHWKQGEQRKAELKALCKANISNNGMIRKLHLYALWMTIKMNSAWIPPHQCKQTSVHFFQEFVHSEDVHITSLVCHLWFKQLCTRSVCHFVLLVSEQWHKEKDKRGTLTWDDYLFHMRTSFNVGLFFLLDCFYDVLKHFQQIQINGGT